MIGSQINMERRTPPPRRRVRRGCLFWSLVLVAGLVGLVLALAEMGRRQIREFEVNQRRERAEFFEAVKTGDDGGRIYILDAELVNMLASDPQCVENLTQLHFMADLSDPGFADVRKLTNVHSMSFYDCVGVGAFLDVISGMPLVEELLFDLHVPHDDVQKLANFPNLRVMLTHQQDDETWEWLRESLPGVELERELRSAEAAK